MSHILIEGSDRSETLTGSDEHERILGHGGNDKLLGLGHDDKLYGDTGNDYLSGGTRNDYLDGGANIDKLEGGSGADTFRFAFRSDSPFTREDSILDFNGDEGDKIDLRSIDADTRFLISFGNQSFSDSQLSYDTSTGVLRANVYGGDDVFIKLVGAPSIDLAVDILE